VLPPPTQTPALTVQRVWTRDVGARDQASFVPGEAIQYTEVVHNATSQAVPASIDVEAIDQSEHIVDRYSFDYTIPPGVTGFYTPSYVRGDAPAGTYNVRIAVVDKNSGQIQDSKDGTFTVKADNLRYPGHWNGILCDMGRYSGSHQLATANYRGMPACGPRPIGDHAGDVETVSFTHDGINQSEQEYEWECVELSMRFMYIAYGILPYDAPTGDHVVDYYQNPAYNRYNTPNRILVPVANNTSGARGPLPVPGDILSYNAAESPNHTAVVLSQNINAQGNGTIDIIEQNFSPNGTETLAVNNWNVSGIKNWLHHTVDLWPQSAPPNTSVLVRGDSFQANETITIYFGAFLLSTVTADSSGSFSTIITVPQLPPDQTIVTVLGATTQPIIHTVFYVTS
jgi:CHAP domain